VTGDILQDGSSPTGGIQVERGGSLVAEVGLGDRLRLSLNGGGLQCRGTCRLAGAFRTVASIPSNHADPEPWSAGEQRPCDGDCGATPERSCFEWNGAAAQASLGAALDRIATGTDLETGTEDWLCFWDFDKSDPFVGFDDNACYPIISARGAGSGLPYRLCVDVRQGRDNDYPYRLRVIDEGRVAVPLAPGDGCSYVLDPTSGLTTPACRDTAVRVTASTSGILADDEYVGRFIRFADEDGQPRSESHKILQTVDCEGAPPSPHVCGGSSDDILVLGSLAGVPEAQPAGSAYWVDYGWRPADSFFVLAPIQVDSATSAGNDSNVDLVGEIDLQGVHFTNLGGGRSRANDLDNQVLVVGGANGTSTEIQRWRHVIIRNDTANFLPNNGVDLLPDSLQNAVLGHTNVLSNSGHAVLAAASDGAARNLVLEDFSIRHHQDGCFNHSYEDVTPEITVRRAWCAFIQSDALSAQFFAWQLAVPTQTVIEDSGCDACDGGHSGETLRSNSEIQAGGWTVRRSLFWAPVGGVASAAGSSVEESLIVGFRGSDAFSSIFLPPEIEGTVVRQVAIRTSKLLLAGRLDVRDSIFRDVVVARDGSAAVVTDAYSEIRNVAWIGLDSIHPTCVAGNVGCVVASERLKPTPGVIWRNVVFAWLPGRTTHLFGALRFRTASASQPTAYDGLAIAHHDFAGGTGDAIAGLTAANVDDVGWGNGPCFWSNERDVAPAAEPGMPPTTSSGIPLGFVDPAVYRFDTPPGTHADAVGCGLDPSRPAGVRGYHYYHARTGLAPELLADDADKDGVAEDIAAATCDGGDASEPCADNCPGWFNPDQADADGDGMGDACEPPCANGRDDDADGAIDWPADPGCWAADHSATEDPACQNGVDDDGDGGIDFDGGASWNGGVPVSLPDPRCDVA
jgi:hypothetical protein